MRLIMPSALLLCSVFVHAPAPTDKLLQETQQASMLQKNLRVLTDGGRAS
jgi:hypothetical protein